MLPEIKPGLTNTAGDLSAAGWTCALCGFWVAVGQTHYCPNVQPATFDFTAGNVGDAILHQKLDRIADLLGRIVRKLGA